MSFYPTITADMLTPFRAVTSMIKQNPAYLNDAECPYTDDVKKQLALMIGGDPLAVAAPIELKTPEDMERELVQIYSDIKRMEREIQTVDAKDKVQWAKAIVGILERLIVLRERNFNVKQLAEFQKTVIQIMDEVCEPAQRTEIATRLQRFV